jgi:hypothetical protein
MGVGHPLRFQGASSQVVLWNNRSLEKHHAVERAAVMYGNNASKAETAQFLAFGTRIKSQKRQ